MNKTEYVIGYASMFSFETMNMLQSLDSKPHLLQIKTPNWKTLTPLPSSWPQFQLKIKKGGRKWK